MLWRTRENRRLNAGAVFAEQNILLLEAITNCILFGASEIAI